MKKLITLMLSAMLVFLLTACQENTISETESK